MVHTKWRKRVLVDLIAQCQHPSLRTPVLSKNANKLVDCIVHLFSVYVWFSMKGRRGRLLDMGRLLERDV